jgi:hypothetical protein
MEANEWEPGDWVVYRKQKRSTAPGRRAEQVFPAPAGDMYSYVVEKYWIVKEVLPDGTMRLRTRRGKEHVVPVDDPRLRRLRWWERLRLAARFQAVESQKKEHPDSQGDR